MGTRLTSIPQPFIKLAAASRDGLEWFVLGGIYAPAGAQPSVRLYKINGNLSVEPIGGAFGTVGKDDSVALHVLPSGTLRVVVSEAAVDASGISASGTTSEPTVYDFPGIFPIYTTPATGTIDSVTRSLLKTIAKTITTALGV